MNQVLFWVLIISILVIMLYVVYRKNFKILQVPSVCLITGGVKCGKSLLSVKLSIKDYRKRHRIWWLQTHILKKDIEEPMYYTNVTISFRNIKYKQGKGGKPHPLDKNIVRIKLDHLLREKRINYKSVVYIQESSLMSDSMDFNNVTRNVDLSLWNKLFAHEGRGSAMYYDTQSPLDNHYSMKRVSSTYFFIQKNINLFLFRVLYVREMINTENGVNNFTDDVDTTTRKVLIPRWYYKKYDRYEFSYLTDDLEKDNDNITYHDGIVSFNPYYVKRADKRVKEIKR